MWDLMLGTMQMGTTSSSEARRTRFNSVSTSLMVDDKALACIMNNKEDFVGKTHHIHQSTKGIAGHIYATYKGTVKWRLEDDHGKIHTIFIPNAYFMEQVPNILIPEGTGSITNS